MKEGFRRLIGAVLLATLLVAQAIPVGASTETLDQSQTTQSGYQTCYINYACAQLFTAGIAGGLTRARLYVARGAGTGDMVVEVRTLSGGQPTGTLLGSVTVPAANVSTTAGWHDVTFSTPPASAAGTQYALVLTATGSGQYRWHSTNTNPYAAGAMWTQDGNGVWGANAGFDLAFQTYVTPPATNALLSALSLSAGTLTPAFASTTYSYSARVSNATSSLTVTPTTQDPAATVTVNNGSPSNPVNLVVGSNSIPVRVTAPDGVSTQTYTLSVHRNALPTVTGLTNVTILENSATGTGDMPFTIGDADNTIGELTVAATSLNTSIIPLANITLGGSGANRTIRAVPAPNATGIATIQVMVGDGQDVRTVSFQVSVVEVNDPPTIDPIPDQITAEDVALGPVSITIGDPDTPASSLTLTGTSNNQALVPNANIVFTGAGTTRYMTITPGQDQHGTAIITVRVSDGTNPATRSFTLTVTPVNDPPAISPINDIAVAEGDPVPLIPFTVSDLETVATSLSVTATSSNQTLVPNGSLVLSGGGTNRTLSITVAPGQTGTTTITINASDGQLTTPRSFNLTVSQKPVISPIANVTIDEDTATGPIAFTVSSNRVPASSLIVTATSSNQGLVPNANIALGGSGSNRTIALTPAADQAGTATITITVSDGELTSTRTFTLTVTQVNDPPWISMIDDLATNEDTPTAPIPFTIGDLETNAAQLTVTAASGNPVLVPNSNIALGGSGANRTLTITPAPDQYGTVLITVTVSDGTLSASRNFILTVTAVDDPPVINAPATFSILEDNVAQIPVTATDPDSPLAALVLMATSSNQVLVPNANIAVTGGNGSWMVSVTPAPNRSGQTTIILTATDGVATAARNVQLTVIEVNDLPVISPIPNQVTDEDVPIYNIPFTVSDVETPANNLIITVSSSFPALTPASSFVLGGSGNNRTLTIIPAPDRHGTATITITVDDGQDRVTTSFTLTVNSVPDAPSIRGLSNRTIPEDGVLSHLIEIYSPDSPLSSVTWTVTSDNQALVPDSAIVITGSGAFRTLTITPLADAHGVAMITFTTTDGVLSSVQSFSLTVESVNDMPVIGFLPNLTILEGQETETLSFTVADVETAAADLVVTAISSNTDIVPNENIEIGGSGPVRTIKVAPAFKRFGTVTITVRVFDGTDTATRSFTLTITNINDAPSFLMGSDVVVDEDAGPQVIQNWALNVSAGPFEQHQALIFEISNDNPALFAVQPQVLANGTLSFTSALHAFGQATVTLRLVDNGGTANGGVDRTEWRSFVIFVNSVNDLPEITAIGNRGTEDGLPTPWLDFTISDVETPANGLVVIASSSNQVLVPNGAIELTGTGANRRVRVSPVPGRIGTAVITLTVTDPDGGVTTTSFSLIVNNLKLSELIPSIGALTPMFDPHNLTYTAVYQGVQTSATVTPSALDPNVVILVNGVAVPTGTASAPIALNLLGGQVEIVVRAPATGLFKTYNLRFARALSQLTDLANIAVWPGTLTPAFDPAVTSYTVAVDGHVTSLKVEAKPADSRGKVRIVGGEQLQIGTNTITVTSIAENGLEKVYTIVVDRKRPALVVMDPAVEAGAEWASLKFATSDAASVQVSYNAPRGSTRTASSSGANHQVTLNNLLPMTTYEVRIVATRADGQKAEYITNLRTAAPASLEVCRGGEIRSDGPGKVELTCPGDQLAVASASQALAARSTAGLVSTTAISDRAMREALSQAGIRESTSALLGQPSTVVVWAGQSGTAQAAIVDRAAVSRATALGASIEFRSDLGSLTLSPAALVPLLPVGAEQLVVVFEAIPADRADVKPWVSTSPYSLASQVVDVSVATIFSDGRVQRHSRFPVPIKLTLKANGAGPTNLDSLAAYWLVDNASGTVTNRVLVGGRYVAADQSVVVMRERLSKYVLLNYRVFWKDVPATHWAYEVIHQMSARQIIQGKTADLFEPDTPVTRGEFASMLVRAFGFEPDERFAYVYLDVPKGSPLAGEIGGAVRAGLMLGYPDGNFRPDALISRQELAAVLYRLSGRLNLPRGTDGVDIAQRVGLLTDWSTVSPWAQESVRSAVAQGLMTGRSGNTFVPMGITTRAEASTVVQRLLDSATRTEQR